jgi:predicted Zn-dependent protease
VTGCEVRFETEGSRAAAALATADALFAQGRPGEAIAVLREAGRRSFVQIVLFETLAQSLLEHSPSPADLDEAVHWAARATDPRKLATSRGYKILASAYGAQGRDDDALRAVQRGEEVLRDRQDEAGAAEMREAQVQYERGRSQVVR